MTDPRTVETFIEGGNVPPGTWKPVTRRYER